MPAEMPKCRYCQQPYELAKESEDFWEMKCEQCKVGHVFSKPRAAAAGRYRAQLEKRLEVERRIKQWESRPKSVFIDSTKSSGGLD